MTGKISRMVRLPNVAGAPMWRLHFEDGTILLTERGAQVGYIIDWPLVGREIQYTLSGKGNITAVAPLA